MSRGSEDDRKGTRAHSLLALANLKPTEKMFVEIICDLKGLNTRIKPKNSTGTTVPFVPFSTKFFFLI
jgi:hypothetical protein